MNSSIYLHLNNAFSLQLSDLNFGYVDFTDLPIQRYDGQAEYFGNKKATVGETFIQKEGRYNSYVSRFFYFSNRVSITKLRTIFRLRVKMQRCNLVA